jgi:hypothetical protein
MVRKEYSQDEVKKKTDCEIKEGEKVSKRGRFKV